MAWSNLKQAKWFNNADEAVDYIHQLYDCCVSQICTSFDHFLENNAPPINYEKHCYPFIGVSITHDDLFVDPSFAYGVISEPGYYGSTVTTPDLFDQYYREQINLIISRHKVPVIVGYSDWSVPLPFVVKNTQSKFDVDGLSKLQSKF